MKSLLKQLWYIRSLRVRKKGGLSQFNVKNAIFRGKMKIRNITATNGCPPLPLLDFYVHEDSIPQNKYKGIFNQCCQEPHTLSHLFT